MQCALGNVETFSRLHGARRLAARTDQQTRKSANHILCGPRSFQHCLAEALVGFFEQWACKRQRLPSGTRFEDPLCSRCAENDRETEPVFASTPVFRSF